MAAVINMMNCCFTTVDGVIKCAVNKQFKYIHQSWVSVWMRVEKYVNDIESPDYQIRCQCRHVKVIAISIFSSMQCM